MMHLCEKRLVSLLEKRWNERKLNIRGRSQCHSFQELEQVNKRLQEKICAVSPAISSADVNVVSFRKCKANAARGESLWRSGEARASALDLEIQKTNPRRLGLVSVPIKKYQENA